MKNKRLLIKEANTIFLNGMFFKNPILVGALGLYPIVAAGYNLKNAVELSLLFLFISLPTSLLFCLIGEMVPLSVRPGLVLCGCALFYIPAAWLTQRIIPGSIESLGMLAGLMICNSMILSRVNDYAPTHIGIAVFADTLGCSVGFALVICLVSVIRAAWLKSGIWQTNIGIYGTGEKGISLPFFGFILLGFFAAFVQFINKKRSTKAAKRRAAK
jgi:Na+-transporting NADH:ubiquinone oxidoreductase subunit NqrD